MAQEADSFLKKGGDVLRELASHQGAAYRQYGEALQKYGAGEIDAGKLVKAAGDLYFAEVGRVSSSLFSASSEVVNWALGKVGVEAFDQAAPLNKETGKPASK